MAASDLSRTTDDSKLTTIIQLFLDSEPEVKIPATAKRHALDGTKKNCYTAVIDGENLTVPEFFAVGDKPTAVLFRAVKGGG